MRRKNLLVADRWPLLVDVLQINNATVQFAYPVAPNSTTGYQNPEYCHARLGSNHDLGMNVLCAAGNVKWYNRELTSLSVPEFSQYQMLYPVELPYHSLYALRNCVTSYYFQDKDGTGKDVVSSLDNVVIAKNWGID